MKILSWILFPFLKVYFYFFPPEPDYADDEDSAHASLLHWMKSKKYKQQHDVPEDSVCAGDAPEPQKASIVDYILGTLTLVILFPIAILSYVLDTLGL